MSGRRDACPPSDEHKAEINASVTVHVPLSTLEAFQETASRLRRSESDLAREAFEAIAKRTPAR